MPEQPDKLPLQAFVTSVAEQFFAAAEELAKSHPEWEIGSTEIVARVALKPVTQNGRTVICVDVDEPDRLLSDLPIPLRRKVS